MVGEHPTQTTSLPGDDLKPTWRVACVAYRKVRQAGELDRPAWSCTGGPVRIGLPHDVAMAPRG